MTAAFSPWFTDRQPWQPGVYMQRSVGRDGYMRWDGVRWFRWHDTIDGAARETQATGPMYQNHPWRGLAQKL